MLRKAAFDTNCHIEIEQSEEYFHAHVELDGDYAIRPGDQVLVHGDPIQIRFGERAEYERLATVTPASAFERLWTRIAAYLDLKELYEVSFSTRRFS